jgi:hypothetical protein
MTAFSWRRKLAGGAARLLEGFGIAVAACPAGGQVTEALTMRRLVLAIAALSAAVAASGGATRAVVPGAGSWGRAVGVPGLGALNTGGDAQVTSVSCPSAANCAAGGYYAGHGSGGFVAAERNGVWGTAIQLPGLQALSAGNAEVLSVSCASAGNCAAGGYYFDRSLSENQQGFVAAERNGRWGKAISLRGLPALNEAGFERPLQVVVVPAGRAAARRGWSACRGQPGRHHDRGAGDRCGGHPPPGVTGQVHQIRSRTPSRGTRLRSGHHQPLARLDFLFPP